jgi:hypothetical protein
MAEFNPQPIKLQGKEYLEVAQRIVWLRQEHPDAQIVTAVQEHDRAEGYALLFCTITIPSTGGIGTGWGSASRKDLRGPVAAAYLEKAETRAKGRACADLGYGTLAASQEDGDTLADAPVERGPKSAPGRAVAGAATPHRSEAASTLSSADAATIRSAVAALGWGAPDCAAYLRQYGVARFGELTAEQAAEVIPDLLSKAAEIDAA